MFRQRPFLAVPCKRSGTRSFRQRSIVCVDRCGVMGLRPRIVFRFSQTKYQLRKMAGCAIAGTACTCASAAMHARPTSTALAASSGKHGEPAIARSWWLARCHRAEHLSNARRPEWPQLRFLTGPLMRADRTHVRRNAWSSAMLHFSIGSPAHLPNPNRRLVPGRTDKGTIRTQSYLRPRHGVSRYLRVQFVQCTRRLHRYGAIPTRPGSTKQHPACPVARIHQKPDP